MLVAFLLHQGSPCEAKKDKNSQRRYKGYYGYKNYAMGISRFKVISVTRKNFKMEKLMAMLSYPLSIFNRSNPEKEKEFYRGLVNKAKFENWEKLSRSEA